MKEISLTRGHVAIVDDADHDRIHGRGKWHAKIHVRHDGSLRVYAVRRNRCGNGLRSTEYMHREVSGAPTGMDVDHIDGNSLNNRRENLRVVTRSQNLMNMRPRTNSVSGFKGVAWSNNEKKWKVKVQKGGDVICIGTFSDEAEAARAYDAAALEHFGEFARLNFPERTP